MLYEHILKLVAPLDLVPRVLHTRRGSESECSPVSSTANRLHCDPRCIASPHLSQQCAVNFAGPLVPPSVTSTMSVSSDDEHEVRQPKVQSPFSVQDDMFPAFGGPQQQVMLAGSPGLADLLGKVAPTLNFSSAWASSAAPEAMPEVPPLAYTPILTNYMPGGSPSQAAAATA